MQYEVDVIASASESDIVPHYGVVNTNLGLWGMAEAGLAIDSVWEATMVSGHFKVELIDEEHFWDWQPAVGVGMDRLMVGGYGSAAGRRYTPDTEAYDMEFRDNVSPYVVATKTFNAVGTFHLGWGAGRFIGKGPVSKNVHGVFAGYNRRVWKTLEVMMEEDGRDVNVGLRYRFPWFTAGIAVEHVEQFGRDYKPYYTLICEYSPRTLHQGPERLALRRSINDVRDQVRVLARRLEEEKELNAAAQAQLRDLLEEYRRQGINPENLEALQREVAALEREVNLARKEKEEKTIRRGGGI